MEKVYKFSKTVEPHEVDYGFNMSVQSMISTFQTLATYHSIDLGCDYFTLKDRDRAFWVVSKVKLHIDQFPTFGDSIDCSTWYEKPSLIRCPRVYKICDAKGKAMVTAISEWCAIDIDTFRPKKLDTITFPMDNFVDTDCGITFDKNIYEMDEVDFVFSRVIRYTDLDMNMHTNNVMYSRIVMDTFYTGFLDAHVVTDFQIDYINQSKEKDIISVYNKQVSDNFYVVVGNIADKSIFRAFINFKQK